MIMLLVNEASTEVAAKSETRVCVVNKRRAVKAGSAVKPEYAVSIG